MAWDTETNQAAPQWGSNSGEPIYNRDECLMQWREIAKQLARLKDQEIGLRNFILQNEFPGSLEGTANIELGAGFKLKGVFKQTYKLDNDTAKVNAAFEALEKTGERGKLLAERLVNWKPELKVSEYKALDEDFKKFIQPVVTISPAQASLEIIEPKT